MTKTITSIVAVLAVVVVGWWLVKGSAVAPVVPESAVVTDVETTEAASFTNSAQDEESVKTVMISGSEFSYEPATISAKVGQAVTVVYTNTGKYPHDFVIDELNVKSQVIKSGETGTFTFTPDKAGTFSFYCSLPNHREKGMSGTLSVN